MAASNLGFQVVFLHPVHNFALVAYDPSVLGAGASVIQAAKLLPGLFSFRIVSMYFLKLNYLVNERK